MRMPWPTRSCLLTLALTAASLAAPTHTVQKGETFYQIAKEHGLTPDALGKANPWVNPQRLHPGDLLRLPTSVPSPSPSPAKSAPTTPTQPAWVKIQKGDTLSKISRQTGVSIEDLRRWNQLSDNSLSIGKILRLSPPRPHLKARPRAETHPRPSRPAQDLLCLPRPPPDRLGAR